MDLTKVIKRAKKATKNTHVTTSMPKECSRCGESKGKAKFTDAQWKKGGTCRVCQREAEVEEAGGAKAAAAAGVTAGGTSSSCKSEIDDGAEADPMAALLSAIALDGKDGKPSLRDEVHAASGGGAASASGGGAAAAEEIEFENVCPVCFANEDTATVDGVGCGQCFACGQLYCGNCSPELESTFKCCPTCSASVDVSAEEDAARLHTLLRLKPDGRHVSTGKHGNLSDVQYACNQVSSRRSLIADHIPLPAGCARVGLRVHSSCS